jgi:phage terminase small subunit
MSPTKEEALVSLRHVAEVRRLTEALMAADQRETSLRARIEKLEEIANTVSHFKAKAVSNAAESAAFAAQVIDEMEQHGDRQLLAAIRRELPSLESRGVALVALRAEVAAGNESYRKKCDQLRVVATSRDALQIEVERLTREWQANAIKAQDEILAALNERDAAEARAEKAERNLAVVIGKADRLTKEYLLQAQAMEVERDAARTECSRLREAFGMDLPAPVHDLLDRLADAAVHLLNDHNCDQHGWEGIERSVKAAREAAARIRAALTLTAP